MRAMTSALSAICGTHFGDTNAVASTTGSPAAESRSISSTLTAVEIEPCSFCRPSRGPTSTSLTRDGNGMATFTRIEASTTLRVLLEIDELRPLGHLLADCEAESDEPARRRRRDRVFHFHRFEDQERRIPGDVAARCREPGNDAPRHRRDEPSLDALPLAGMIERIAAGELVAPPVQEHVTSFAARDHRRVDA